MTRKQQIKKIITSVRKIKLGYKIGAVAILGFGLGAGLMKVVPNKEKSRLEEQAQQMIQQKSILEEQAQQLTPITADILCDTISDKFYVIGKDTIPYEIEGVRVMNGYFTRENK